MSLYGTFKYGQAKYGWRTVPADHPVDQWRRVYGGAPPWLSENRIYERQRQWAIGTMDSTHLWSGVIDGLAQGSQRHITDQGAMLPQETLSLNIADAEGRYLEGGKDFATLAPDSLIQLRSIVTTASGTLTWYGTVYRITTALSRDRDRFGRGIMTTSAEDWLRSPIGQPCGAVRDPFSPLPPYPERTEAPTDPPPPVPEVGQPRTGAEVIVPQDSPLIHAMIVSGAADAPAVTWLAIARGCLSVLAGGNGWSSSSAPDRCTTDPDMNDGGIVAFSAVPAFRLWDDWLQGSPAEMTWAAVLESILARYGWKMRYALNGWPHLSMVNKRVDSGLLVSSSPLRGGALPVPWESYSHPSVTRPSFTRVEYWSAAPSNLPWVGKVLSGSATSTHPDFPHRPPFWKVERLDGADLDNVLSGKRLSDYLAKGDRISIKVDSACPIPDMGQEVRFYLPDDGIDAMYRIDGATQPLGLEAGSWELGWRGR